MTLRITNKKKFTKYLPSFKDYEVIELRCQELNRQELDSLSVLSECKSLRVLIINNYELSSLDGLENLISLEELQITDCCIKSKSIVFNNMQKLRKISIYSTICSISGLENLSNLSSFDCDHNIGPSKMINQLIYRNIRVYVAFCGNFQYRHKFNPYKIRYCCGGYKYLVIKVRIKKSVLRLRRLFVKNKITQIWLSFFELARNNFSYNRISYFLEMIK